MDAAPEIAAPRPAATLLVLRDDPFEVLMLRRQAGGTFPSALVFPGGAVDPDDYDPQWDGMTHSTASLEADDRAFRIAAVRETWEEAGILVALAGAAVSPEPGIPFRSLVAAGSGGIDLDELRDFSHWVTPVTAPRRFDTRFFVARAPEGAVAAFDGIETVSLQWTSPRLALDLHASGEVPLLFPTMMNLVRLAESDDVEHALAAAPKRPRFVVLPVIEQRGAARFVSLPAEAGYGAVEEPVLAP